MSTASTPFKVRTLPGFDGFLPFQLETGYISVDELDGVQLFYYFIESERNPKEDPLILWLSGGPGCSAFTGLVYEIVYIGGDSYAGIVVPIIAQEIANGIMMQHKPIINLEGYILGNAATDGKFDGNSKIPFSHRMALISDELYKLTKRTCKGEYVKVDPRNVKCLKNLQTVSECTKDLKVEHVLEPNCKFVLANKLKGIQENRRSLGENFENFGSESQLPKFGCRNYNYLLSYYWANDDNVRSALHIKKGTTKTWIRCNNQGGLPYKKDVLSTLIYHQNLSKRGYRSLIYSGDHDLLTPYLGTEAWIKSLNYSINDDWRPWFVVNQVAGYTRTYSNRMTYATVKGAGHTAPEYMPKECLAMLSRWLSHNPL
ncbi:Serine carboxypeptidase-like [Thalictrum thalictroides]|uniref:Serine carboxypeptidase-like n=1 Tax=Thalictrum thalictroides TaxID=46969 RepID=A0A7J6WX32_THATH|nr:Serine carboxypeptidase-like [Thalictrum thalictroides]